jgi:hypothetical protein
MVTPAPATPPPGGQPGNMPGAGPQRRNRQIHVPGAKGGHFRRVWSEKLHKFYIKYGDDPGTLHVRNAKDQGPGRRRGDNIPGQATQSINTPVQSVLDQDNTEEMLNGIYEQLLANYQIGDKGSGPKHKGHAVTFGNITPANGEIVHHPEHRVSCYLYNEKGDVMDQAKNKHLRTEDKIKHFFCYMTARYAIKEFIDGKRKEQAKKSLFLEKRQGGSDVLKKAYAEVLIDKTSAPKPKVNSYLPKNHLSELRKSIWDLERPKQKRWDDPLARRLSSVDEILSRMEKAGKSGSWAQNGAFSGRRYGSAGSGSKAIYRRPGRPPGTGQGLTAASAQMSAAPSLETMVPVNDTDWAGHRELKIGARVKVQHPYSHDKPRWCRISAIGTDGIQVTDEEGNVTSIRWPHIHAIEGRVENTPINAFEIARTSIPMTNVPLVPKHQMDAAENVMRKLAMPMAIDLIHDGHDDRNTAYSQLFKDKAPIDDIEATKSREREVVGLAKLTQSLIDHALSTQAPVDPDLLRELPFERVIAVLHHHVNGKKHGHDSN